MIKLLLLLKLIILLNGELVSIQNQCTCEQIMSQKECQKSSICVWTSIYQKSTSSASGDVFQCVSKTTATQQQSNTGTTVSESTMAQSYCSNLSDSECITINGCALFQSECMPFSGCSAYAIAVSSSWCQKINTKCVVGTQDTVKQCTDKKSCQEYTQQIQCETSPSTSGNFKCKWESDKCRDVQCKDAADKTECTNLGTNCLFNGVNCLAGSLPSCISYTKGECEKLIGSEGTCITGKSNYCEPRQCSQASSNLNTDKLCNEYKSGCLTTGKGCTQTRGSCSQYEGSVHTCSGYIGSDGNCEGIDETIQKCQAKKCSSASTTYSTDSQCEAYQINCKSTGKGCTDQLKSCTTYTSDCNSYIGSEGKCTTDKSGTCRGRWCSDWIGKNDTDCNTYLAGCKTNGQACVQEKELSYCASYDNTITQCENYIGRDGRCIQDEKDKTKCRVVICSDATNQKTDEQCNNFLTGCVSNGSGCQEKTSGQDIGTSCGTSSDQIMSHSDCQAFGTNCTSDGQKCIIKTACVKYQTLTTCQTASTTDPGDTCVWNQTSLSCSAKQCSDKNFTTNDECNQYLSGCITNGVNCVTQANATCASFTEANACIKNSNKLPCIYYDKKCFQFTKCGDITSDSHSYCNAIQKHCTTNGIQCIPITACEEYKVTESCAVGINEAKCGWAGSSCITFKDCSEYKTGILENCQSYNSDCVTNGTTCIKKMKCTEYTEEQSCRSGGTDGSCFFEEGKCRPKECKDVSKADISDTSSHEECQKVKLNTKCTSNGNICVPMQKCIDYKDNQVGCVLGLDGECTFNIKQKYCRPAICEDYFENCEQVFSDGRCTSNGTYCILKQNCSQYKNKEDCKKGFDGQCRFITIKNDENVEESSCQLITKCEEASDDEQACKALSHVCSWSQISVGTDLESKSCLPLDCKTMQAQNNGECKPVPDFLEEKYMICYKQGDQGECSEGEGNALQEEVDCFEYSAQTYRWIENKCQACFQPTSLRIVYNLINDLFVKQNLGITLLILILLWS